VQWYAFAAFKFLRCEDGRAAAGAGGGGRCVTSADFLAIAFARKVPAPKPGANWRMVSWKAVLVFSNSHLACPKSWACSKDGRVLNTHLIGEGKGVAHGCQAHYA